MSSLSATKSPKSKQTEFASSCYRAGADRIPHFRGGNAGFLLSFLFSLFSALTTLTGIDATGQSLRLHSAALRGNRRAADSRPYKGGCERGSLSHRLPCVRGAVRRSLTEGLFAAYRIATTPQSALRASSVQGRYRDPLWLKTVHWTVFLTRRAPYTGEPWGCGGVMADSPRAADSRPYRGDGD